MSAAVLVAESRQVGRGRPGVLRGGSGVLFALGFGWGREFPLLIDIVKRERETQAARVLAGSGVTWSRMKQRSTVSF